MAQTRITSGEYRGRIVDSPRGRDVRPTTALVRKALFDILGNNIEGMVFVGTTKDWQEGVDAFAEKRRPVYKGR